MEEFIRTIGFGVGAIAGFLLLCYGFADFTISHCQPVRELYECEFEPESDTDIAKMLLFGLVEIASCGFVIAMLYLIGSIFR